MYPSIKLNPIDIRYLHITYVSLVPSISELSIQPFAYRDPKIQNSKQTSIHNACYIQYNAPTTGLQYPRLNSRYIHTCETWSTTIHVLTYVLISYDVASVLRRVRLPRKPIRGTDAWQFLDLPCLAIARKETLLIYSRVSHLLISIKHKFQKQSVIHV